ncbi:putative Fe-S electron transport protein [Burkholderiales bacterium]|nr:putative Fe-S electron transport protein [Burkholderiales bacterium]
MNRQEQGKHSDSGADAIIAPAPAIWSDLVDRIKQWGTELGFGAMGIADLDVAEAADRLQQWLQQGFHGQMQYLQRHAALRAAPATLQSGALRVISARLDYRPRRDSTQWVQREQARLGQAGAAVVSIYARGRDYHKVMRARLGELGARIAREVQRPDYRPYCDSAPLLEVELARKAGLGWRGKHTLLLTREAGSMFFLGEILTDLPLPVDAPTSDHCGTCVSCISVCPTRAIVAPYRLDARRCISYLTIEHPGSIPEALRPLIGNRVYGCDDCQLVCPWNRYAQRASLPDFDVRNGLDSASLVDLFSWSAEQFATRHAGSAILRIGHERWLRNLAVGLGNARTTPAVIAALRARLEHDSELVREHVGWALRRHGESLP